MTLPLSYSRLRGSLASLLPLRRASPPVRSSLVHVPCRVLPNTHDPLTGRRSSPRSAAISWLCQPKLAAPCLPARSSPLPVSITWLASQSSPRSGERRLVARGGFEPPKPLGRQIYSLLRLTASLPRRYPPADAPGLTLLFVLLYLLSGFAPLVIRAVLLVFFCLGLPRVRSCSGLAFGGKRGAGEGI